MRVAAQRSLCLVVFGAALSGCSVEPAAAPGAPAGPPPIHGPHPAGAPLSFADGPPTHVLMLSIDTLRRDALRRYGGSGNMPYLDGLAATGVVLDDHTTCANWTYPGVTCALMGLDHVTAGFVPDLADPAPAPDGTPWLAERLADVGYETALVSTNGFLSSRYNTARGYGAEVFRRHAPAEQVLQAGEEILLARSGPSFVHLHLYDPHLPYDPPEAYLPELPTVGGLDLSTTPGHHASWALYPDLEVEGQEILRSVMYERYRGELRYLDHMLETHLEDWRVRGLLDDTLVVVWSDHGESMWERSFQAHAWLLTPPENSGILLFWAQGLAARAWRGPTHATDLVPTLLSALGLPVPDDLDGEVLGRADPNRTRHLLTVGRRGPDQGVVRGDWKVVRLWKGRSEAFLLPVDPQMRHPRGDAPADLLRILDEQIALAAELLPSYEAPL